MTRAGFIGTGGISGVHLRYLASREDVEIAALCDVSEENLKKKLRVKLEVASFLQVGGGPTVAQLEVAGSIHA